MMSRFRGDTVNFTRDTPRLAPADIARRSRASQRALRAIAYVSLLCIPILALPTFYIVRDGTASSNILLLPAIILFPILSTPMLFLYSFAAISRLTSTLSMRAIVWHGAAWLAMLIVGTLWLAAHLEALGWTGAGWVRSLGALAIVVGLPAGVRASARYAASRQRVAAIIGASRERRAAIEAEHASWKLKHAATVQWGEEVALTHAAVKQWYGRNHASTQYGLAAHQALTTLLQSDELAESNPARIERLRAFRSKVEAGERGW